MWCIGINKARFTELIPMEEGKSHCSRKLTVVFIAVTFLLLLAYVLVAKGKVRVHVQFQPENRTRSSARGVTIHTWASINPVNVTVEKSLETGDAFVTRLEPLVGSHRDWYSLPDKLERLLENPIYRLYNLTPPVVREKVDIVLIVSSAPKRLDRRTAIRETWWEDCKPVERLSIRCVFLTDYLDPSTEQGKALNEESRQFQDMRFQNMEGGVEFGKRFLYHMVWAMAYYDFKYFLRLDDDYFLCVDRFVKEVPMPPRSFYHWGWVHCIPGLVRPEESIILLSRDLVETFIGQDPDFILCHKWADQMIGIWNKELGLKKFYRHDRRVHHDPPSAFIARFKHEKDICHNYIAVHGSYPVEMRTLWRNRGPEYHPEGKTLDDFSGFCEHDSVMDWRQFGGEWHGEPKLCKDNPVWEGPRGEAYNGRQGHK